MKAQTTSSFILGLLIYNYFKRLDMLIYEQLKALDNIIAIVKAKIDDEEITEELNEIENTLIKLLENYEDRLETDEGFMSEKRKIYERQISVIKKRLFKIIEDYNILDEARELLVASFEGFE